MKRSKTLRHLMDAMAAFADERSSFTLEQMMLVQDALLAIQIPVGFAIMTHGDLKPNHVTSVLLVEMPMEDEE